jgi:hypothetical protein
MGVPPDTRGFATLTWPAAVTAWRITVVALVLFFRSLPGHYALARRPRCPTKA